MTLSVANNQNNFYDDMEDQTKLNIALQLFASSCKPARLFMGFDPNDNEYCFMRIEVGENSGKIERFPISFICNELHYIIDRLLGDCSLRKKGSFYSSTKKI